MDEDYWIMITFPFFFFLFERNKSYRLEYTQQSARGQPAEKVGAPQQVALHLL